jgi:short-subunit dehydrogenase
MQRLIIITGASRGIGAQIAIDLCSKFDKNTVLLLISRNKESLDKIKNKIINMGSHYKIFCLAIDFAAKDIIYYDLIKSTLDGLINSINELYVYYNHGTLKLGSIEHVLNNLNEEFQVNVFSVWSLLVSIIKIFPTEKVPLQYHINISSLLASKPKANTSVYSSSNVSKYKKIKS